MTVYGVHRVVCQMTGFIRRVTEPRETRAVNTRGIRRRRERARAREKRDREFVCGRSGGNGKNEGTKADTSAQGKTGEGTRLTEDGRSGPRFEGKTGHMDVTSRMKSRDG